MLLPIIIRQLLYSAQGPTVSETAGAAAFERRTYFGLRVLSASKAQDARDGLLRDKKMTLLAPNPTGRINPQVVVG